MANNRRRVVIAQPKLRVELIARTSPVVDVIDEVDALACLNAPPVPTLVKLARLQFKELCPSYSACKEDDPFFSDGFGILCNSGRDGQPVHRGRLCEKACRLGCPDDIRSMVEFVNEIQPVQ